MKRLYWLVFLAGLISLGATSQDMDNVNPTQTSVSNTSPDNNPCPQDTYNVAWDSWSPSNLPDFPVSYRAKKHEPNSNKVEYIMLCKPDATGQTPCGGKK